MPETGKNISALRECVWKDVKNVKQYVFGIDIGGTKTAVILSDLEGNFLERRYFCTAQAGGPMEVISRILKIMEEVEAENGLVRKQIASVGISCGGPLDERTGVIYSPPNLPGWDGIPITQLIHQRFGVPAYLQNDANACARAEWRFGAGRGTSNMVFLTFGTGLGAGLILNGKLYSGTNGMAGEVGHWRLAQDGPVGFGKAGSFEGFCSGGGLAQLGAKITGEKDITAKELAKRAYAGDEKAKEVFQISATYLGMGLSLLIDVLNPERIVLGSIYERCEDLFRPRAMEIIAKEAITHSSQVCQIVPAQLGDRIGDYAAISIALDNLPEMEDGDD